MLTFAGSDMIVSCSRVFAGAELIALGCSLTATPTNGCAATLETARAFDPRVAQQLPPLTARFTVRQLADRRDGSTSSLPPSASLLQNYSDAFMRRAHKVQMAWQPAVFI